MKHNWEYKQLGEIGVILTGSTPSTSVKEYYDQSDYMFVKPGDIEESGITYLKASETYISELAFNTASRKLPKHSVLVTCIGTIGKVGILQQEATCNQQINAIIPAADNIYYKYLAYAISSIKSFLISKKNGPVVPIINKTQFSKFKIPVPPMEVQEQIVAELDKINETIEDCRELLRNLDALAQSLFYDFFGDPITNPKGWPIDKLGNLLIIERGGSPRPIKEYITQDEDGINWIKIGDANSSMYISSTKEKIKPSGKSKSRFVKPGDFILSNSMSFGRPYIMNTYGCIHDGWLLLRDNNNFFNKIYLYYCLNSKSIYSEFERLVRTGTVSNLNSDIVRGVKIPVPPLAHQEKFAERIEQIEAQKKAVEQTIAELQTLLDSRMDYWFN